MATALFISIAHKWAKHDMHWPSVAHSALDYFSRYANFSRPFRRCVCFAIKFYLAAMIWITRLRCFKSFFNFPTILQSLLQRIAVEIKSNTPIANTQRFAVKNNYVIPSSISLLLCACRPPAIFWRIWPVVIDTIYGMLRGWRIAHVCIKVLKITPFIANRDSTLAIISIRCTFRARTSCNNLAPSIVHRCSTLTMSMPSAAAANVAAHQSRSENSDGVTAIASANPRGIRMIRTSWPSRNYRQSSKLFSYKIICKSDTLALRHCESLLNRLEFWCWPLATLNCKWPISIMPKRTVICNG